MHLTTKSRYKKRGLRQQTKAIALQSILGSLRLQQSLSEVQLHEGKIKYAKEQTARVQTYGSISGFENPELKRT